MTIKLPQILESMDLFVTLLILAFALRILMRKVNAERQLRGKNWKLTIQIEAFDVVVGAIFILVTVGRFMPALFLRNVSVQHVLGLCVLIGAALAVRRHALKRNGFPFDFKLDLWFLLPAVICLVVLWDMVEVLRSAGGH
ncbi:hypothetical protein C5O80_38070 [Burkholderia sp. SRS-46]|nr:hypothetical protein C5O80_38070 [Burkholderia sp. SRS-46]